MSYNYDVHSVEASGHATYLKNQGDKSSEKTGPSSLKDEGMPYGLHAVSDDGLKAQFKRMGRRKKSLRQADDVIKGMRDGSQVVSILKARASYLYTVEPQGKC